MIIFMSVAHLLDCIGILISYDITDNGIKVEIKQYKCA